MVRTNRLIAMCINKEKDSKGKITGYILQNCKGQCVKMSPTDLKRNISAGEIEVINLRMDKAGRLITKTVVRNENSIYTNNNIQATSNKIRRNAKQIAEYIINSKVYTCMDDKPANYLNVLDQKQRASVEKQRAVYDSIWGNGSFDKVIGKYAENYKLHNKVYYAEFDCSDNVAISKNMELVKIWLYRMTQMYELNDFSKDAVKEVMHTNVYKR